LRLVFSTDLRRRKLHTVRYADPTRHSSTMPDWVHLSLSGWAYSVMLVRAVDLLAGGYDREL